MKRGAYRPSMFAITDWRPSWFYDFLIWPALILAPTPKRGRRRR